MRGASVDERAAREVCFTPATELIERYRRRELSPVEVAEATLARIERLNPELNAYVTVTADRALSAALDAERAYAAGDAGALAGLPLSIKDLTLTAGVRTTRGSLLWADWVPDEDAPFVERAYAAGAMLLGKTNTPEFGWKGETTNRVAGSTHNPWRHGRTAGGSSGGAAAAVAAGLGQLAQGTDGAGSVRIPAAFCGVFGMKPSLGLLPYYPPSSVPILAHNGPLTRTVRDAALLLNATAAPDARDPQSFPAHTDFQAACDGGVAGLRVAWSPDLGFATLDPEVREIATRAARLFSDLGCHVEEATPPLPDPWDIVDTIWSTAQAGMHVDDFDETRERIDAGRIPVIEHGRGLRATDLVLAHVRRNDYLQGMRRFMQDYDLLLTPTLPVTAFPVGADQPGSINGVPTSYLSWTAFTYPFNVTGQPAATAPCGFASDGLPVGLQLVSRWRDDATVLRASAAFEAAAPWVGKRPEPDH